MIPSIRHHGYEDQLCHLNLPTIQFADLGQILSKPPSNWLRELTRSIKILTVSFVPFTQNTRTRGHNWKLKVTHHSVLRSNFFTHRVTNIWNKLSISTVNAPSVIAFKQGLRHDLTNHPILYVTDHMIN